MAGDPSAVKNSDEIPKILKPWVYFLSRYCKMFAHLIFAISHKLD